MEKKKNLTKQQQQPVIMANQFVQRTGYKLSLIEQKIILYLISKLQPEDKQFKYYDIPLTDFYDLCGISTPQGSYYKFIKDTFKSLSDKSWWVVNFDEEGEYEDLLRWIDKVRIYKKGYIKVRLHEDLRPHLLELKKNFTQFELSIPLSMKSKYSVRLYEILRSYKNLGKYNTQLEPLKELLNAQNYNLAGDFFRWCINPAVKEINAVSDLEVHITKLYDKYNRKKITGIAFEIKEDMYPEIQMQMRADLIGKEV